MSIVDANISIHLKFRVSISSRSYEKNRFSRKSIFSIHFQRRKIFKHDIANGPTCYQKLPLKIRTNRLPFISCKHTQTVRLAQNLRKNNIFYHWEIHNNITSGVCFIIRLNNCIPNAMAAYK